MLTLVNSAVEISATDWMASPALEPILGNMFSIFVIGETYEKLKNVFDKLAEGAKKEWFQDLHEMPFGTYGQFFDRYSVQLIFKRNSKNRL
jgi:PhnB protein